MEKLLLDLLREIAGQWLAVSFAVGWLVYKTGVVQSLVGMERDERAILSQDQQKLVENLQRAVERLDRRVTEEREECSRQLGAASAECDRRLAELRLECDREMKALHQAIETLTKGESRWRHLVGNLAQYVSALQSALRKAGIEVPRFQGWEQFIADGGDPLLSLPGEPT